MKPPKKHIDTFLRQKLGGYKVPVEDNEWEALASRLPAAPPRKRPLYLFVLVFFVFAAAGTAWWLGHIRENTGPEEIMAQGQPKTVTERPGNGTPENGAPVVSGSTGNTAAPDLSAYPDQQNGTKQPRNPRATSPGTPVKVPPGAGSPAQAFPDKGIRTPGSDLLGEQVFPAAPAKDSISETTEIPALTAGIAEDSLPAQADPAAVIPADTNVTADAPAKDPSVKLPAVQLPSRSYFYLGGNVSILASGYTQQFTGAPDAKEHKNYREVMNGAQAREPSFSARLIGGYVTRQQIFFSSGMEYNRVAQRYSFRFTNNQVPVYDTVDRIIDYITLTDSAAEKVNTSVTNVTTQVSVPVSVGYRFRLSNKISMGVQAGGNAGINFSSGFSALSKSSLEIFTRDNATNRFNFGVNAGMDIGVTLPRNWLFEIGFNYRKQLNSLYVNDLGVVILPYNYGINLSIKKIILP